MRFLIALALALAVVGCSDDRWPKNAGDTSCRDWLYEMTADQRADLAEAVLAALWERDGAAQVPPEAVVLRFALAIGGVCVDHTATVGTVAVWFYGRVDDFKPGSE